MLFFNAVRTFSFCGVQQVLALRLNASAHEINQPRKRDSVRSECTDSAAV